MSAHVNLVNVHHVPGGLQLPSTSFELGGVLYTLATPAHQVNGGSVVVRPVPEVDEGSNSIRLRFDQWQVANDDLPRSLPLQLGNMRLAVEVAMAFEADPGIGWSSPEEELYSWAMAWLERHRNRAGGER